MYLSEVGYKLLHVGTEICICLRLQENFNDECGTDKSELYYMNIYKPAHYYTAD